MAIDRNRIQPSRKKPDPTLQKKKYPTVKKKKGIVLVKVVLSVKRFLTFENIFQLAEMPLLMMSVIPFRADLLELVDAPLIVGN